MNVCEKVLIFDKLFYFLICNLGIHGVGLHAKTGSLSVCNVFLVKINSIKSLLQILIFYVYFILFFCRNCRLRDCTYCYISSLG